MITVHLKNLAMTPRKVRLVAKTIRRKSALEAETQLSYLPQRAARPILKLLRSGLAIADQQKLARENLVVQSVLVGDGPRRRKMRPGSRGRAKLITKRLSHVSLIMTPKTA